MSARPYVKTSLLVRLHSLSRRIGQCLMAYSPDVNVPGIEKLRYSTTILFFLHLILPVVVALGRSSFRQQITFDSRTMNDSVNRNTVIINLEFRRNYPLHHSLIIRRRIAFSVNIQG